VAGSARTGSSASPVGHRYGPPSWLGDSVLLTEAYSVAVSAHGSRRRATDERLFLEHVVEVGCLLHDAGFDDETIAVGLLHDAVERGTLGADRLDEAMGPRIAALVMVLSEDSSIASFEGRKAGLRAQVECAGSPAVDVYAADKLSDVLGLQRGIETHSEGLQQRMGTSVGNMLAHYRESIEMVVSIRPDSVFLPALRTGLENLETAAATSGPLSLRPTRLSPPRSRRS
jgi:hypothetical protein